MFPAGRALLRLEDSFSIFFLEYLPGDEFRAISRISLATDEEISSEDLILGPGRFVVKWRRLASVSFKRYFHANNHENQK